MSAEVLRQKRRASILYGIAASIGIVLSFLAASPVFSAHPRVRALSLLEEGEATRAVSLLDSLLRADPHDLPAAWLAACGEEAAGRSEAARIRHLELEAIGGSRDVARLACLARRRLEAAAADSLTRLPSGWDVAPRLRSGPLALLLPLENFGDPEIGPGFGLFFSYLLYEALAASELPPVGIPEMLAVEDLLAFGRVTRAPAGLEALPVNSLAGLARRLELLPARDGSSYLNDSSRDPAAMQAALLRFQSEHDLLASGEADPATQRALEHALEVWALEPPPPLPPSDVSRVIALTGARVAFRGTYRIAGEAVEMRFSWLDRTGEVSLAGENRTFALADAGAEAERAALLLTQTLGGRSSEAAASSEVPESFRADWTAGLLLADRGLPARARARFEGELAPWPLLARTAESLALPAADAIALAAHLEEEIRSEGEDDFGRELDAMLEVVGGSHQGAATNTAAPSVYRVLGGQGLLRIRVEGP